MDNLKLHIFIDVSIIEIFINNREVISSQFTHKEIKPQEIRFFALNGEITIKKLDLWILDSIWNK